MMIIVASGTAAVTTHAAVASKNFFISTQLARDLE
jgi:hypothetical protein